jgi:hypothetical protein
MPKLRVVPQALAGVAKQGPVSRHLERPELRARCPKNFADVSLGGFSEDQPHEPLLQGFALRLIHERLELLVGFELRPMTAKRFHAFVPCGAKHLRALGIGGVALLERLLTRKQYLRNACESASRNLRFSEAGDFLRNLAGINVARHRCFPQ